jgi:hypothetical protein
MKDGVTDTIEDATLLAEKLRRETEREGNLARETLLASLRLQESEQKNAKKKNAQESLYCQQKEAEIDKLRADAELVRAQARYTNAQATLQEQTAEANKLIAQLQRLQINKQIETFNAGETPAN